MIDIILLLVIALVTWCVAGEGPWGAAFSLIIVIFSGLLAMNFFEPLAAFLQANVAGSYEWQNRWDLIALLGIFAGAVFLLKEATVRILPVDIPVHPMAFDVGRWALGVATGYVTMAFLLAALHTAPLPREFMGFAPGTCQPPEHRRPRPAVARVHAVCLGTGIRRWRHLTHV